MFDVSAGFEWATRPVVVKPGMIRTNSIVSRLGCAKINNGFRIGLGKQWFWKNKDEAGTSSRFEVNKSGFLMPEPLFLNRSPNTD
jgi:hypothetical protein